jgi:DNA-binding helix-hairpin-helix protein with protein kinase domain
MQRTYRTGAGQTLQLKVAAHARLGAGGQGQVFPASLNGTKVAVKLLPAVEAKRLEALQRLHDSCGTVATLPQELVYGASSGQGTSPCGYVMRYVDPQRSISAARLFNFEEIQRLQRYTWQDAVLAAWRLADSVAHLHRHGVVIGDLNPENVVFEQRPSLQGRTLWQATILDTDSFQLDAAGAGRHHCPVSRPPYTAPELIGSDLSRTWRQASADDFALAVIVYQLLLHDHPYDNAINTREPDLAVTSKIRRGLYPHAAVPPEGVQPSPWRPAPKQVSAALDQAFRRSFCAMPSLRPSAAEWVLLMRQLHGELVPCSSNRPHHHPREMPCLWCAVEQRLGPLCSFPGTSTGAANTARSQDPAAAAAQHDAIPPLLLAEVRAVLARGQQLQQTRSRLTDQLLQLEEPLQNLRSRCGDRSKLIDQADLEARLKSLRCRISRWLGHDQKRRQREHTLRDLQLLCTAIATDTVTTITDLEQQRQQLLKALADVRLDELGVLINGADPDRTAEALISQACHRRRQQWLSQQLSQIPIRSWQIQGFGSGRINLLESHGLIHGEHLRSHLDRLTALPGIGKGLQEKLRSHLASVIRGLEAQGDQRDADLDGITLVSATKLTQLNQLETQLKELGKQVRQLKRQQREFDRGLQQQLAERDRLLKAYGDLF